MTRPLWIVVLLAGCAAEGELAEVEPDAAPLSGAVEEPAQAAEPGAEEIGLADVRPEAPLPDDTGLPAPESVAPDCTVVAPADGAAFASGTSIRFAAEVTDADGDLAYVLWASEAYGTMVLGESFAFILPDGVHRVSATAVDAAGGRCTAAVTITVGPPIR